MSGRSLVGISVVTLFADDVAETKAFHLRVLGAVAVFEDATSAVIRAGHSLINLLLTDAATELVAPHRVDSARSGARAVFTIDVGDVDRTSAQFVSRGVHLLNGPLDRPWGVRTASFADPAGHVWEIAQRLDHPDE